MPACASLTSSFTAACSELSPRVPMPPPVRDRWVHIRFSRGSEYSSCASSTATGR